MGIDTLCNGHYDFNADYKEDGFPPSTNKSCEDSLDSRFEALQSEHYWLESEHYLMQSEHY